ncbi:MAG: DUF1015 domain-containing protein [Phycisphaerales bacterium]|jgi:uncharacterized protein (DUF1015 family)|nr:DUF1015 domain-containing protein [Phycisphaerales bacterium]
MPLVSPFRAIQFTAAQTATSGHPVNLSDLLAPPYDVLDQRGKDALLARNPDNIVAIDLPHLPAKQLGPDATYAAAAQRLSAKMTDGTFARRPSPVMFAYRQTFTFVGKQHQRTGLIATIDLRPFGPAKPGTGAGGGVLPHEQTFSGPKEDRLALMRATRTQLSPIFGLLPDDHHHLTNRLAHVCKLRHPQVSATSDDGTLHELWTIDDQATLDHLAADCREQDVFIADGHHRYTTALNYLAELEKAGPVAPDHPARRCMFVLISMHEPGLVIGPTHRVLAGMADYSWEHFERASKGILTLTPVKGGLGAIEHALQRDARKTGKNELGLYDFESQRAWLCTPTHDDPLRDQFPDKPMAWRTLDVALCQHLIVERICQPKLNAGQPVQWAFPHSIDEVHAIGQGQQTSAGGGSTFSPQLAVIVDPTPLSAVRDVSRANELMPQKSTFFFPKLATGLAMHALE